MTVRAKVFVSAKSLSTHTKADGTQVAAANITFAGAYKSPDIGYGNACEENRQFGEATPSLHFTMYVINPAAHEQLEQGKEYYVDITPADPS